MNQRYNLRRKLNVFEGSEKNSNSLQILKRKKLNKTIYCRLQITIITFKLMKVIL